MAKKNFVDLTTESFWADVTHWLTFGIDIQSRRIHIDTDVSSDMATLIIRGLMKMIEISHDPIEIYLSTYGGDAYAGLAIYDVIRSSPAKISVFAYGKIMSAGFIIFLASDERFSSPNTTFMMHSISMQSGGKIKDQEIDVQEGKRLNNLFLDILSNRTKMKKKWWYRQILSHDKFMDVKQAFEYGIITHSLKKQPKRTKRNGARKH